MMYIALYLQLALLPSYLEPSDIENLNSHWPETLFHAAYPGGPKQYGFGEKVYSILRERSQTITIEQADAEQWTQEMREVCDWIYALKNFAKIYPGQPIAGWTVEDLRQINSWLTRLTSDRPGVLSGRRGQNSRNLLEKLCHKINNWVGTRSIDQELLQESHTKLGAQFLYTIYRLKPFDGGNAAFGRLFMYSLLRDGGLPLPIFANDTLYLNTLLNCYRQKDSAPLHNLLKEMILVLT